MPSFQVQQVIQASNYTPERQRLLGLLDLQPDSATYDASVIISGGTSDVAGPSYIPSPLYETGWVPDYAQGGIRYVSQGRLEEVDENGNPLEAYDEDRYIPCPPAPRIDTWELAPWLESPRIASTKSSITYMDYPEMPSPYPACPSTAECTTATYAESPGDFISPPVAGSKSSVFASQQAMHPPDLPYTSPWSNAQNAPQNTRRQKSVASMAARQKSAPYPKESPRIPLTPKNIDYSGRIVDQTPHKANLNTAEVSAQVQETIPKMYSFSSHFQAQELLGVNARVVESCDEVVALLRQVDHVLRHAKLHRNPNASSHLRSLQRTLKRLVSVAEYRSNTWDHATRIVEKLDEHTAKLVNLLNKLTHKP